MADGILYKTKHVDQENVAAPSKAAMVGSFSAMMQQLEADREKQTKSPQKSPNRISPNAKKPPPLSDLIAKTTSSASSMMPKASKKTLKPKKTLSLKTNPNLPLEADLIGQEKRKKAFKEQRSISKGYLNKQQPEPLHEVGQYFGRPLSDVMDDQRALGNDSPVPALVTACIDYLLPAHVEEEGLFRVSGKHEQVLAIKKQLDDGLPASSSLFQDVEGCHTVTSVMKMFVRELPDSLIPKELQEEFLESVTKTDLKEDEEKQKAHLITAIAKLGVDEANLVKCIAQMLNTISLSSQKNLMTASNLSVVWSPNVMWSSGPITSKELQTSQNATAMFEVMIQHAQTIFQEVKVAVPAAKKATDSAVKPIDLSAIKFGAIKKSEAGEKEKLDLINEDDAMAFTPFSKSEDLSARKEKDSVKSPRRRISGLFEKLKSPRSNTKDTEPLTTPRGTSIVRGLTPPRSLAALPRVALLEHDSEDSSSSSAEEEKVDEIDNLNALARSYSRPKSDSLTPTRQLRSNSMPVNPSDLGLKLTQDTGVQGSLTPSKSDSDVRASSNPLKNAVSSVTSPAKAKNSPLDMLKSVGTVGRRMSKDLTKKLSELKDSALDSGSPLKRILSPSSTSTSSTSTTNNEEKSKSSMPASFFFGGASNSPQPVNIFAPKKTVEGDAMEVVVDEKDAVASTSSPFSSSSNMSGTLSRKKQLVKSPTININKGKKRTIEESGDEPASKRARKEGGEEKGGEEGPSLTPRSSFKRMQSSALFNLDLNKRSVSLFYYSEADPKMDREMRFFSERSAMPAKVRDESMEPIALSEALKLVRAFKTIIVVNKSGEGVRFSGPISGVSDADLASLISSTDAKEKEKKKEKGEKKGEKEETLRSPAIFSKATNTVILGWSAKVWEQYIPSDKS